MSSDLQDGRDLRGELESPESGHRGIPVDAICTSCKRVRVKRAARDEVGVHPQIDPTALESGDLNSFKHVCHPCQGTTWWNPVAVLTGLIESDGGDDDA